LGHFEESSWKLSSETRSRNLKIDYADGYGAGNKRMIVTIAADWTISVQMSPPDLVGWEDDWNRQTAVEQTSHGTRGRENKQTRDQPWVFWREVTQNMRGGNAWINHAAFVAIDAQESHPIVLGLARTLVKTKLYMPLLRKLYM
jgi:hypothetical protein